MRRATSPFVIRHSTFVIQPVIFAFMHAPNILVVVVDGLRASALGAYGNTSFPTPALDRFTADSFLLDWCYAPTVDLAAIYHDLWRPRDYALLPQLQSRGYTTILVTDEPLLSSDAISSGFHQRLPLGPEHAVEGRLGHEMDPNAASPRASNWTKTSLATLVASALHVITTPAHSPRLVWLHARGMYGVWDAPRELQRALLDEGDPPPVEETTPPDFLLTEKDDPDAAFRYATAYAAQTMVLDECWDSLISAIDAGGRSDAWIITLLGARGYPLGEHRRVGGIDLRLYAEQLHVPWLIRFTDGTGRLVRSGQLTTHADLAPTLLDASDRIAIRTLATTARPQWRDALIAASPGHRAIRTAEWCLRQDTAAREDERDITGASSALPSPNIELFVRPDDRWEANDVVKLCPDVVESLTYRLDEVMSG
jgi:arylsulfatase A-like enzyme